MEVINKYFEENRKRQALTTGDEDKSRKGSVDERILPLLTLINNNSEFFTTSTCSGRIILFTNESIDVDGSTGSSKELGEVTLSTSKIKKKGCRWLMVTHDELETGKLKEAWEKAIRDLVGDLTFQFSPAILHVQCKKLSGAKKLIHAATEAGFRNSGIVVGANDKITVAIRSTLWIEVPLTSLKGQQLVSQEYLEFLVEKANEKMQENWRRLEKLKVEFQKAFSIIENVHPSGAQPN